MKILIKEIERLKNSPVSQIIKKRVREFASMRDKNEEKIFSEMCFCILTANSSAESCIKVQKGAENYFLKLDEAELSSKLKSLGARFHTKRASYICCAKKYLKEIHKIFDMESSDARDWLVQNIKGLGMKEASHFLRNVGFEDVAIIDFHIIDLLEKHDIIERPKSLTRKNYIEMEKVLDKMAKKAKMSLAELDLYLWYIETGKVLK